MPCISALLSQSTFNVNHMTEYCFISTSKKKYPKQFFYLYSYHILLLQLNIALLHPEIEP